MALSHSHSLLHPRIDAHLHFWRYSAGDYPWIGADMRALAVDRTPGHLLPQLSACGFTGAIAVQARATVDETRFLLELARRNDWIRGVVGWEDLTCEGLGERLQDWRAEPRLCGWRHQVQDEPDAAAFLAAPHSGAAWPCCSARAGRMTCSSSITRWRRLPPSAHGTTRTGWCWTIWASPAGRAGPGTGRIRPLAGAAGAFCRAAACGLQAPGLVTEADWRAGLDGAGRACLLRCLDMALQVFGPQRLMFGSDWPVCLLAAPYATVFELVDGWASSRLSASEREALWGGTAARCYGLHPQGMT